MAKRWFTIMFDGPDKTVDLSKATLSPSGTNYVAFDGDAEFLNAQEAAHKLAQHCANVWVFVGQVIGRQIAHYENGTYKE